MKTTLRAEDAADLKLPGKFQQTVNLKCMIHRKIRRPFIKIRPVHEGVCLRDKASIRAHKRAVRIGPPGARFSNNRRNTDETIGRQRVDSQLVISLVGESIVAAQRKPPRKPPRKTDHETIVSTLIPWTKRSHRSRSERR